MITVLILVSVSVAGWYTWDKVDVVRNFIEEKVSGNDFQTLEIRYSSDEIIQNHRDELLKDSSYTLIEPKLLFYPYLLMEVKYTKSSGVTGEGTLLWGLSDGEMVLDTHSWEKTHGFEDCLLAKASKNDFKVITALVESGGVIDRERLFHRFKVDHDILDDWVDSCRSKKLIALTGNKMRLHFQSPKFGTNPITKIGHSLVTNSAKYASKCKRHYSPAQIRQLTQIVFGKDFGIRKTEEVFLPVHRIAIQNPDGSIFTTYWNALTGKRLDLS